MACPMLQSRSMILTLVLIWIALSMVFFGSLAIAASRPIPSMNIEVTNEEESFHSFSTEIPVEPDFSFAATSTSPKFESLHG